ncbi:SPFH domain-containing protein [Inquilinus limosus]|uniref:Band 7 domain-containing protein n=1 Tax=Inquilinus limosus TaxID=171674 RepID=A0A211ZNL8_9PROT|nr:SPFH domain-containing protein [Inquilinus limosus]OWJ66839.1 hypothetical protein BWR60_12120 [Inquilinus limosus]
MSTAPAISDRAARTASGYAALALALVILAVPAYLLIAVIRGTAGQDGSRVIAVLCILAVALIVRGLYVVQPNQSAVLLLFGAYTGTDGQPGLRWANPLASKRKVSRRLQTQEIPAIKVNDAAGNPIEIGAAVVWHVRDAAKAVLQVDDYAGFVRLQSETALRRIASTHPYDDWEEETAASAGRISLRDGGEQVTDELVQELRQRLERAGIEVVEARITHLAYAPEIAGAMLRRQQASAVVAARRTIVKGAVDLVDEALTGLREKAIEIDPERKAAMISNMLVVLVGDKDATPVINTGTLYS